MSKKYRCKAENRILKIYEYSCFDKAIYTILFSYNNLKYCHKYVHSVKIREKKEELYKSYKSRVMYLRNTNTHC